MAHLADDDAAKLVSDMKPDIDRWIAEEEFDFQSKYDAAIQSVGPIPFLAELFRRFEDSALTTYLGATAFLWKDLPFLAWKAILYRISDSGQAVYQFVWFAASFLGLDISSIIRTDPNVDGSARELISVQFPGGAPKSGGAWERQVLEDNGVDPLAMWRRLASEGAPMKIDASALK
jgi:hypothetical protein